MKRLRNAIASIVTLSFVLLAKTAIAQTYRAGDFTITLGENNPETGRTYQGCDSRGNCIRLHYGTSWRNGNRRGITWENGDYFYVISWQDGDRNNSLYLTVFHEEERLLHEQLQPLRSPE